MVILYLYMINKKVEECIFQKIFGLSSLESYQIVAEILWLHRTLMILKAVYSNRTKILMLKNLQ